MAKTRGGHTVNTGRQSVQRKEKSAAAPREVRRLNRNLNKLVADLGVSSQKMKQRGQSSKGKTRVTVSLPSDSSTRVSKPHGTALIFRSPKFATRFQKLMINKTIVFGKPVDSVLFHNIGVTDLFEKIGLSAMLFLPKSAYPVLIKQFYGNMSVKSDKINTFVQDKTISIDSALLGSLFEIPCTGPSPFTLKGPLEFENLSILEQLRIVKDFPTAEFVSLPNVLETTPLNSVIHKIIRANLIPRIGGRSDMTFQDLILSALILSGKQFNCALLMINHMESCIKTKSKCFPYGGFLTKVFAHFKISFENEEVCQLTEVIDESVFTNSKLKVSADGVLSWDIEDSDIPDFVHAEFASQSPTSVPVNPSIPIPQISELYQLVQVMSSNLDSILVSMNSLSTSIASLSDRITTVADRVDSLVIRHDALDVQLKDLDKKVEEDLFENVPVED